MEDLRYKRKYLNHYKQEFRKNVYINRSNSEILYINNKFLEK